MEALIGICSLISFLLIPFAAVYPSVSLKSKFAKVGDMTGKTLIEISEIVGKPNSVSFMADNEGKENMVCQWIVAGFHIVLIFDENGIFKTIASATDVTGGV